MNRSFSPGGTASRSRRHWPGAGPAPRPRRRMRTAERNDRRADRQLDRRASGRWPGLDAQAWRAGRALADSQVDRACGARHMGDDGWLVTLPDDPEGAVASFEPEVLNIGGARLAHPQPVQAEEDGERSVSEVDAFGGKERPKTAADGGQPPVDGRRSEASPTRPRGQDPPPTGRTTSCGAESPERVIRAVPGKDPGSLPIRPAGLSGPGRRQQPARRHRRPVRRSSCT